MSKKASKKLYNRELSKALKERCKPTRQRKQKSKEHELFEMIDNGLDNL